MYKQKGSAGVELLLYAITFAIVIIGSVIWGKISCSNYGELTNRITKYSIVNGCFVKTDSGWIPQEEMSKRAYGNSITENQ